MAMRRGMEIWFHPLLIEEGCRRRRRGGDTRRNHPGASRHPSLKGGDKLALNIAHSFFARPLPRGIAIFPPQFFSSFPFSSPGGALFGGFNTRQGPKAGRATG